MFKPTVILLVTTALIWAAYDIWAVAHSYEWTISATLYHAAQRWPAIPFVGGFLLGHTLFPNKAAP